MAGDATPLFACLTGDLVDSKLLPDRGGTQVALEAALRTANKDFRADLVVPLTVTLGDEWQGLLRSPAAAFRVDFSLRRALHPLAVRTGIGIGGVTTPMRERTPMMDGPCFHRSREALVAAKKRRGPVTVLSSADAELDDFVNAVERLLHGVMEGWTDRQHESVMTFLDQHSEAAAAQALGVAQPTLHKSVAGALGKELLAAIDARNRFLARFAGGELGTVPANGAGDSGRSDGAGSDGPAGKPVA